MTKRGIGNVPDGVPLAWSIDKASREFGRTEYSIRKLLKDAQERPDAENCFTTGQLTKVLYGSLHEQRLKKIAEEVVRLEFENAVDRSEYLNRDDLESGLAQLIGAIVSIIRNSNLDREAQNDVLNQLSGMRYVLTDVASRQNRLRSQGGNGAEPEKRPGRKKKRSSAPAPEPAGAQEVWRAMHETAAHTERMANGHFFDSAAVEDLIRVYQTNQKPEMLGEVIRRCEPIVLSLIRSKATMIYENEDELTSIVNTKLLKSLPQYCPIRGTAFAYVSRIALNMLASTVTRAKKLANRYPALDEVISQTVADPAANIDSQLAVDDLCHQIRAIKSACELESERQAQRWLVESFIDAEFCLRRHEYADACMKVYRLSHRRSRDLYDLTLLEVRRVLWTEARHEPVSPEQLRGARGLPLLRYTNFLTPPEFAKFAVLMKDLAPSLVVLVRPTNEAQIRGRNWSAVRENLVLILEGDPTATPLFG
jgi:hypothetical protein